LPTSTDRLFDYYYYKRSSYRGGTTQFHALCSNSIAAGGQILEIGAGPSNSTSDYLSGLGSLTGVDVSAEVRENRALQSAHVYDGTRLPFEAERFDACVSNYVLEHVANPDEHFREIRRVLRGGGVFVFRTPNLIHYVALTSRLLPHAAHRLLANRLRGLGEESHEPWPTVYRANTRGKIARLASQASLHVERCVLIEPEPTYGSASRWLFFPMMWYERLVNSTETLATLRANILGVLYR
jgi:SAM-dependent methyltransferase